MHLPTHALVNLTALEPWAAPEDRSFILLGALLPDLPVLAFYFVCRFLLGHSDEKIWKDLYYRERWFNIFAVFHSIPLTAAVLAAGLILGWPTLALFGASMLLHNLADLPVHAKDAHRHLYPLSNYRFESPLSYWNPRYWGRVVAVVEALILLGCSVHVYPVLATWWAKATVILANFAYLAGYLAVYHGPFGDRVINSMAPD